MAILHGVARLLICDETVIIVASDHGGHDKGHGGKTMMEMETPLVFYGKNIKEGFDIPESTMVMILHQLLVIFLESINLRFGLDVR